MMIVEATHDFASIGQLCGNLQQTPRAIERACDVLKIKPAMRLNGVLHFDAAQAEKITAHFREAAK